MSRSLPVNTLRRSYQGKIEAARRPMSEAKPAEKSPLVASTDTAYAYAAGLTWTRWRGESRGEFRERARRDAARLGIAVDRVAFHFIAGTD